MSTVSRPKSLMIIHQARSILRTGSRERRPSYHVGETRGCYQAVDTATRALRGRGRAIPKQFAALLIHMGRPWVRSALVPIGGSVLQLVVSCLEAQARLQTGHDGGTSTMGSLRELEG
jgi:hypothetical protein